jgi:MFS family permease
MHGEHAAPGRLLGPEDPAAGVRARGRGARALALEGFFQSVTQGLGETYLSALAVWLGAGGPLLGIVSSLPTAAAALSQVAAARLRSGVRSTLAFIAASWSAQALAIGALGACALLPARQALVLLCVLAFLAWALAGVAVPSWTALVSRTVPRAEHGWFFGLRGAGQQAGVTIAILGGGLLLTLAALQDREGIGFVLVFFVAGLSRLCGNLFLLAVPPTGCTPDPRPRGGVLLDALKHSAKFRRLCAYLWSLHFATWIASPFFIPYMIRDLRLPYYQIGLLVALPAVVKVLTLRHWGRVADAIGPGALLRRMGWMVLPVSALWLVSGAVWWIFLAQVYAGLIWGALELAQASSLLQTSRGREGAVALFNLVDGGVMIAASLLGGAIVSVADRMGGRGFLFAIGVSSVLRALPAAFLLWRVRGLGSPLRSHLIMPLRLWGVRPARGMTYRPWVEFEPTREEEEVRQSEVQ